METIDLCNDLISTYDEYVGLFEKEINTLLGYAIPRGYRGNEESYQNGIRIREKIKELKQKIDDKKNQTTHEQVVELDMMLKAWDYVHLKCNLIQLLDNNEIELLSFFRYPSCVRNVIISTSSNSGVMWLKKFGDRVLEEILPKYNMMVDNKIAIEFRPIIEKGGEYEEAKKVSSLWFGSKDGVYSIGISAENMDGFPPMKLEKKLKND